MLRASIVHVSICAALLLASVLNAGWKWEGVTTLPH
jgi:hypothetical protein